MHETAQWLASEIINPRRKMAGMLISVYFPTKPNSRGEKIWVGVGVACDMGNGMQGAMLLWHRSTALVAISCRTTSNCWKYVAWDTYTSVTTREH